MKHIDTKDLIEKHTPATITKALAPYITEKRHARIDAVLQGRLQSIHLAIESPSDINNALAAVRTAEALGVHCVHFITPEGDALAARKITQGAFYWVDIRYHDNFYEFLQVMREEQIALAGGAVTATKSLHDVPVDRPLCIMVGNEQRGLSSAAIDACDHPYKIPMVGMSESFNLSVSAAISLYDITTRKRSALGQAGDLDQKNSDTLRAQYFLNSLNPRLSCALLK
jgi:tRNA (guanosine-2'-O-)-methyltransferase